MDGYTSFTYMNGQLGGWCGSNAYGAVRSDIEVSLSQDLNMLFKFSTSNSVPTNLHFEWF